MTLARMDALKASTEQELQDELYRRKQARLDALAAMDKECTLIRKYCMDKHEGGVPTPTFREACQANLTLLESELARVRLILDEIRREASPSGIESGNTTIHSLVQSALEFR